MNGIQREKLRLTFLDLLEQSNNKVFDTCMETEEDWGYIVCFNKKWQEIKIVFKKDPMIEVYIDGVQLIANG